MDLNHDGHAELLIGTYDESASDAFVGPFCSGHWRHQLYRFQDFGAEEIRGPMGGITFPFIHDWTYPGTECAAEQKPILAVRPAHLYEHGTSTQGVVSTTIRKIDNASGLLNIDPVAGCKAVTAKVVVYDRPQIREIVFPNQFGTYSADLADRIGRGARWSARGTPRYRQVDGQRRLLCQLDVG